MTRSICFIVLAAFVVFGAFGCGPDKTDNSKIESPSDQPIGMPGAVGGEGKGLKSKSLPLNPTITQSGKTPG